MEILPILEHLIRLETLALTTFGTVLGIFLGAAPGLNGPIGVALLLPLTYSLDPADGLLMLGGIYMGVTYGGSIVSILLNCPGTGEASCTVLDGYPLAQQGRPRAALLFSIIASTIGGLAGVLVLIFLTPVLAGVALRFGPPEMLVVALAGLSIVGGLTGKHLGRGMFAVSLGVLLSMVGPNLTGGGFRFTLGIHAMRGGVSLIPIVVGLFAIAEMVLLLAPQAQGALITKEEKVSLWSMIKETWLYKRTLSWCVLIGLGIGILPGTGGAVAAFVGYGEAKRVSKHPERFGHGAPEGILGPESANSAAVGGSLVPMMALGIPGSATSAIMFGALTIHNLIPGPSLLTDNAEFAYTFMFGMLLTVVITFICGVYGVRLFASILRVPPAYLVSSVLVFTTIGVYSVRNSIFDLLLCFVFGALGILFKKTGVPAAPILLGHILGPLVVENLGRCLVLAKAQGVGLAGYVVMRPISLVLVIIMVFLVYSNFKQFVKPRK